MHYSASSLKDFIKCGFAFKLKRIDKIPEPGKKAYGLIHGRVHGLALQLCSDHLAEHKVITEADMDRYVLQAYREELPKTTIPDSLLSAVEMLFEEGFSPDTILKAYHMSDCVNTTQEWYLKLPPMKVKGGISESSKTPHFARIVEEGRQHISWFFSTPHADDIARAQKVIHEQKLMRTYVNSYDGVEYPILGYADQLLVMPDESLIVVEFKTDKTPYTQAFVDRSIQLQTYHMLVENLLEVRLFDISHEQMLVPYVADTATPFELIKSRYDLLDRAVRNDVFIPICGTDPFNSGRVMCGFKGSCHCPHGDNLDAAESVLF